MSDSSIRVTRRCTLPVTAGALAALALPEVDAVQTAKPVAFTHWNCRALNNHPRPKSDRAIRKLAAKGGAMGITGVRMVVRDKIETDGFDHPRKVFGLMAALIHRGDGDSNIRAVLGGDFRPLLGTT